MNTNEVCFGARGDSYGPFTMKYSGAITSFKLVHLSGSVACYQAAEQWFSYWGCNDKTYLRTFLTNNSNAIVFPQKTEIKPYIISGIRSDSKELVFHNLTVPLRVAAGQEFRVWYDEDLKNESEHDNGGKTCMDIYALYI